LLPWASPLPGFFFLNLVRRNRSSHLSPDGSRNGPVGQQHPQLLGFRDDLWQLHQGNVHVVVLRKRPEYCLINSSTVAMRVYPPSKQARQPKVYHIRPDLKRWQIQIKEQK
jgi:hypothetical protein